MFQHIDLFSSELQFMLSVATPRQRSNYLRGLSARSGGRAVIGGLPTARRGQREALPVGNTGITLDKSASVSVPIVGR